MIVLNPQGKTNTISVADEKLIREAILSEQVIVYPTDTLYGLGADATSSDAVQNLYDLKARQNSPVSVLLESVEQLLDITVGLSEAARHLINKFLPGALTVICNTNYPFPNQLVSSNGTVGFRVPGDQISRSIVSITGKPITTTSVNPAGKPPATSRMEVESYFEGQIPLMLDIGAIPPSNGSTVIDLSATPFKILREGEISRQALADFLN